MVCTYSKKVVYWWIISESNSTREQLIFILNSNRTVYNSTIDSIVYNTAKQLILVGYLTLGQNSIQYSKTMGVGEISNTRVYNCTSGQNSIQYSQTVDAGFWSMDIEFWILEYGLG